MSAMLQPPPEDHGAPRTFRAETLEAALQLVREELGPDAIVLRQREGVIGGVGGFFGRRCVELEVEVPPALPEPRPDAEPRPAATKPSGVPDLDWAPSPEWLTTRARAVPAGVVVDLYDTDSTRPEPQPEPQPDPSATSEDGERHDRPAPDEEPQRFVPFVPEQLEPESAGEAPEQAQELEPIEPPEPAPAPAPRPASEAEPEPPEPAAEAQPSTDRATDAEPTARPSATLESAASTAPEPAPDPAAELEIADEPEDGPEDGTEDEGELMRTLMAQAAPFTNEIAAHMAGHMETAYERTVFGRRLADQGLGDRLAREIVAEAETELRVFDPTQPFEEQVRTALARRIRVARGVRRKRRVIALVGPPGSGKTLTAARLCHAYRSQRRDIAALSLQPIREAFRLVEHTRALDVPLLAADEQRTLPVELEKLDEVELLIVDTPGVRPGESERLRTLGALLELVGADETHLLVPASLDANQVRALVESFADTLGVNRIMITHLDGPGGPSAAVSASIDSKLPISFTATGVSWGMRPADPHTLAELVVA